jgi:hypothetical protein
VKLIDLLIQGPVLLPLAPCSCGPALSREVLAEDARDLAHNENVQVSEGLQIEFKRVSEVALFGGIPKDPDAVATSTYLQ